MSELVVRYSMAPHNIMYWELGNEPDVDAKFLIGSTLPFGCLGDTDDDYYGGGYYAEMLKVVNPTIKELDPEAKVLIGLLLDFDPTNPPEGKECKPVKFLEWILRNGGEPYFDIVSFHGYPFYMESDQDRGLLYFDEHYPGCEARGGVVLGKIDFLREVMATYGTSKPIFQTEGALACPEWNQNDCTSPNKDYFEAQADYVVWLFVRNWAENIDATIWYEFEGKGWRNVGMIGETETPKLVYQAYRFITEKLDNAVYIGAVTRYPGVGGYAYTKDKKQIWVLWAHNQTPHTISLPSNVLSVKDKYGDDITPGSSEFIVESPIYVNLLP